MRERFDERGVDGEHGVEKMGEADAMSFGDEAEETTVAVETPGATDFEDLEGRFAVAEEQFVAELAGRVFVGELDAGGAEPFGVDDGDKAVGEDASDGGAASELFERWPRGAVREE